MGGSIFGGGADATAEIDDHIEGTDPNTGEEHETDVHIELSGDNESVEQAALDYQQHGMQGGDAGQMGLAEENPDAAHCESCGDNGQRQGPRA